MMENSKISAEVDGICDSLSIINESNSKKIIKQRKNGQDNQIEGFISVAEQRKFAVEKKRMIAVKNYKKYISIKNEVKQREKRKLAGFMKNQKLPKWYLELSLNQMAAADSLHTSIRDDLEQGTVHRCRQALLHLGLKPLVDTSNINLAIKMCAASDFAFLWFLMELFYDKTCDNCRHPVYNYTVNEQIIMSAICHLDMVTTLRQLDKILPKHVVAIRNPVLKQKNITKMKCVSPYLMPLVRPENLSLRSYTVPKLPPVHFNPYDKYLDESYVVPNEATRWFQQDITEEVTATRYEPKPTRSSVKVVTNILEKQLQIITSENFDRGKIIEALCNKHKTLEEVRKNLLKELTYISNCKNLEYFRSQKNNERARQRIINQMELDQAKSKEEFENLAEKYQLQTWLRLFLQDLALSMPNLKKIKICSKTKTCQEQASILQKVISKSCCICKSCPNQNFDFGHQGTPKLNEIFFRAPRRNIPYKFDYEKVFQYDFINKVDPVRRGIAAALELDKYGTEGMAIEICLSQTWRSVVKLWHEKFDMQISAQPELTASPLKNNSSQETKSSSKSKEERSLPQSGNYSEATKYEILNQTKHDINLLANSPEENKNLVYDPRNRKTMEDLLKTALNLMKQSPQFVLASLPDVHQLPILQEWIQARYGRIHTRIERAAALEKSTKLFEQLLLRDIKVHLPKLDNLWPTKKTSYENRKIIGERVKNMVEEHHHELRLGFLDDAHVCWQVMKPYLCTMGPPRNIFFAYMPASEYDVNPFRPWKTSEFRDAKYELEKRLLKKKHEDANKI